MTSKIIDEVYTDNNGNVAESFSDLLRAQSPDLYGRLIGFAEEEVEDELTVLIDKIEEHDDVQNVYSNFDIPDEIMEKIEGTY